MTKKSKGLLLTGLVLPFVAGVLVEVATDVSVLGSISAGLKALGTFFGQPISMPLWAALLLPLAGLAIVAVGIWIAATRAGNDSDVATYTSDLILGLKWRWDYLRGGLDSATPFCPRCDHQPEVQIAYLSGGRDGTQVTCDNCGFQKEYEYPPMDLRRRAIKHVQRKIRTGEYKKSLPQQNA